MDEIVRWVTPVNLFRRTAMRDIELGGRQISEGDKVVVFYGSANRDEAVFADPTPSTWAATRTRTSASAAAARTSAWAPTWPGWSCVCSSRRFWSGAEYRAVR